MAKQIFNSSEKTNFILNMTEEKYSLIASWGILSAVFCTTIATAVPVFTGNKLYTISAMGLTLGGVICMILALIGMVKKYISKSVIIPVGAMGVTVVWAVLSLLTSSDKNVGMNGFPGRGEGLLAIIFYACIFLTALSLKGDKARNTVIGGIIGNGVINSIVGILQIFTGNYSDFNRASLKLEVNAASGLSQTPLFLAMVLSISTGAALSYALITKYKSTKAICLISACLFSFVTMFTYSFVGICGLVLSAAVTVIMVFAAKAPKLNFLSLFSVIVPAVAAFLIVQGGNIGNIDSYRLYDGRLFWFADSYMRINSSGDYDADAIDIDDIADVHYNMNRKTMNIIENHGFTGTGPDQLAYPQIYTYGMVDEAMATVEDVVIFNKGVFDRVYNEYLYTAATRGIPSAIAFVVTVLGVLVIGFRNFKKRKNPVTLLMTLLTGMSAVLFLICCTSTAFTPIFWAIAGCALVNAKEEK